MGWGTAPLVHSPQIKNQNMTPFETAIQQVQAGTLQTPKVMYDGGTINYFKYQLAVHKFNLGIMASGMSCRGIKLRDLKQYYGLKGKTAKQCLEEFTVIMDKYTGS